MVRGVRHLAAAATFVPDAAVVAVDEEVVDRAQRGQAGGDDADCVFDEGPDGGRDECPGGVWRGETVEDGHAIDAPYADKAPKEEDAY